MDRQWGIGLLLWLALASGCSHPPPRENHEPPITSGGPMLGSGGLEGPSELHSRSLAVGGVPPKATPSPRPIATPHRPAPAARPVRPRISGNDTVPMARARPRPAAATPDPSGRQPEPSGEGQVQTNETPRMSAVPELGGDLSNSGRGSEISYLLLEINPSEAAPPGRLFLGLVVDVSGSMGDDGVQLAAESCAQLFGALGPADHGYLVAFASDAKRLSLPRLDAHSIREALNGANVGGGTRLGLGIEVARDSMPEGDRGTMRHLMLVTDGFTNDEERCKSISTEAWKRGISISGIGIGNCDTHLLKSIAERCFGTFYHVSSLKDLAGVVVADRRNVESVVLRNVEVEARFAPGVEVRRAFRVGPLSEIKARQGRFALGHLHSRKPLQLLFELEVKGASGRTQKIAEVDLHSRNPDGSPRAPQPIQQIWAQRSARKGPANPHVMALVDRIYAAMSRR